MALLPGARRRAALVNAEVAGALQHETDRLARRCFYVWVRVIFIITGLYIGLSLLVYWGTRRKGAGSAALNSASTSTQWSSWLSTIGVFVLLAAGALYIWRTRASAATVARVALAIILINGWTQTTLFALMLPSRLGTMALPSLELFLLACLAFPWGLRQTLIPPLLLLPVHELVTVLVAPGALARFGTSNLDATTEQDGTLRTVALHAALYAVGLVICAVRELWRRFRFRQQFISTRYAEVKGELAAARKLHESLLPAAGRIAGARLEYLYEPLTEIGGDLLFALSVPGETAHAPPRALFAILDVTGHGIAAALTVQRIHREVERTLAGAPGTSPGELLAHVNRFIHATLSGHSMYATMTVCRVDFVAGTLEYASAGHPPALLLHAGGQIETLDSTTFILGVASPDSFHPAAITRAIGASDRLLLYTDGLIETMGSGGRALGVKGLVDAAIAATKAEQPLCRALTDAAAAHRVGATEDDLLVACIQATTRE